MSEYCNPSGLNRPAAWASSFARYCTMTALAGIMMTIPSPAFAQTASGSATANKPAPPCSMPDHRAFDFWIGEWDVTSSTSTTATAVNRISAQHGGCIIREEYKTSSGYSGMSMSFYDAPRKIWHQTWMGVDGTPLYIEGGLNAAGQMVLSNANWPGYVAATPINRVTWTPNSDGSVRQRWQKSDDGGKSWSDVFDGRYVKRDAPK
ncbi:MAG: hypothetical protein AAGE37_00210 [Pseudomonadota bacterium]